MIEEKKPITVIKRVEKKYLLTKAEYNTFMKLAKSHIKEDCYPRSMVHNIYFDTHNYDYVRHSIENLDFKEKFRFRCYGTVDDNSSAFLEIKRKVNGVVYKRRVLVNYKEGYDYLVNHVPFVGTSQIAREIDYFTHNKQIEAKVIISYFREAFYDKDNINVRITFDSDLRFTSPNNNINTVGEVLDNQAFDYILEIKASDSMPLWLVDILSIMNLYNQSYSKYGLYYIEHVLKEKRRDIC